MTPYAEPSPYHDRRPLLHDLHYHVEPDGRPVLDPEVPEDAEH